MRIAIGQLCQESNTNKTAGMPNIWPGYQAFASYDLQEWFLVPN